ncbi:uncharacterized protein DUF3291 [Motilibacter rhizosphaerae]|uniref:Uncharacterized protein DUF3291 n=1 Tax=Motilibacter rhizosphaerae TaxID=598652 RepID=A0A4V2F4Z4_9ACTN|nr:DUF3291 domain-containing protein [Motilibacter rhizosphaerae]RZS91029.1 uncharacterized protein DUF3291 [Motilibacter rhizosphaerae]
MSDARVPTYHLAQVNIGRTLAPLTSEQLAGFVELLEPVNALADASPGFVWRLQGEAGDATEFKLRGDELLIVNMSVWESLDELGDFVFRTMHAEVMRRRREWFERLREVYTCLWWVPEGHVPTVAEAEERLAELAADGPSPVAFTFQRPFPAPGVALPAQRSDDWLCLV